MVTEPYYIEGFVTDAFKVCFVLFCFQGFKEKDNLSH